MRTTIETKVKRQINSIKTSHTVAEISDRSGINQTTTWRMLNGISKIKLDHIVKLESCGLINFDANDIDMLMEEKKNHVETQKRLMQSLSVLKSIKDHVLPMMKTDVEGYEVKKNTIKEIESILSGGR